MRRNNRRSRSYDLTMNVFNNLIQRCHQHREQPLRQRKTIVTPALYKDYPYHFTVHCARGCPVRLYDLEQADISFMPIGHAPEADHPPGNFGGQRFLERQGTRDWIPRRWYASWGIQIYTGVPSGRDGAQWHDINFKYDAISAAPDAILTCIEELVNSVANPLLTLTKSGGLRFSCRVLNYLHSNTEQARQYIHKHIPTKDNPHHRDVYLEILGETGYNRWDGRYEILLGNLLDPPFITKEVLFAPIDALRDALHEPAPPTENNFGPVSHAAPVVPSMSAPVDEKVIAVREGKLSPLAIKRPTPVLDKSEHADASRDVSTLRVLEHDPKTGWLCAIDETEAHLPFVEISISKDILDAWMGHRQMNALRSFAQALLNALESKSELYENPVRRVRMTMQAFEAQEETLIQQMSKEGLDRELWNQLKRFFQHYKRDADAPMVWDRGVLRFWVPSEPNGEKTFPDEMKISESAPWLSENQVFQIRTGIFFTHEILNYENSWNDLGLSEIGDRFFRGIRTEIKRDSNVQHILICNSDAAERVADLTSMENVCVRNHIKRAIHVEALASELESADVIWIIGAPYWPPPQLWQQAQILFGDDAEPLCYDVELNPYRYEDERIQALCEQNVVGILTEIIGRIGLKRLSNKTVVLLTGMPLPSITDMPETLLFDWEDFEIAGGLEQIHVLLKDGEKTTAELINAIDGHPGAVLDQTSC